MGMSAVTIHTRKFKVNRLLARRQMLVDVVHPGIACPSKEKVASTLSTLYHKDAKNVICYGFRTQFGGGKASGFALIYDTVEDAKKFEPKHRLVRKGLVELNKKKETVDELRRQRRPMPERERRSPRRTKRHLSESVGSNLAAVFYFVDLAYFDNESYVITGICMFECV